MRHTHIDDLERIPYEFGVYRPLRRALGVSAFGINAYTSDDAGGPVVEPHDEATTNHEELYLVLSGHAEFVVDGETLDAPAGTLVRVAPHVLRQAVAAEARTAVLALGGESAFVPAASEWIERARPHLPGGRGRAILDELHAERPDSPGDLIGRALLAAAEGDSATAAQLLRDVLAKRPEYRAALAADPTLGVHLPPDQPTRRAPM